jgi:hypothetical protein
MGVDKRDAYKVLVRKPEGRRLMERLNKGEDNIKIDFKEILCDCVNCIRFCLE